MRNIASNQRQIRVLYFAKLLDIRYFILDVSYYNHMHFDKCFLEKIVRTS